MFHMNNAVQQDVMPCCSDKHVMAVSAPASLPAVCSMPLVLLAK
jgi:hypothetical protein